ncbi:MAG: TIGR02757 family protein [Muribaculaceae bacterium]
MNDEERQLKILLDTEAGRINSPDFIADDPVQFPRRFSDVRDIEIAALLSATLAWGNRRMICRDCDRMLSLMDNQPYRYMMDEGYEDLPDMNIHRTFFAADMRHYLRGLRKIYAGHGSLQDFARSIGTDRAELPSWHLVEAMNRELALANGGKSDSRCLPGNTGTTALKRMNMALRWLVRNDGIVDLGVWDVIRPSQLYIPLDVHVANVSRQLGLLTRRSNDRKAVLELTGRLRKMRPDDPVFYDYALFGIGVTSRTPAVV